MTIPELDQQPTTPAPMTRSVLLRRQRPEMARSSQGQEKAEQGGLRAVLWICLRALVWRLPALAAAMQAVKKPTEQVPLEFLWQNLFRIRASAVDWSAFGEARGGPLVDGQTD
jgi:hypothetical protein